MIPDAAAPGEQQPPLAKAPAETHAGSLLPTGQSPAPALDPALMNDQPSVILSGFGDEAANQKTAEQQFAAFAAIGLTYYSLRFIDVGQGIKNVMQLSKAEITRIRHLEDEYCLNVATLGSPLGKVKLLDQEDGTKNRFVPFKKYLNGEVKKACE